METINPNLSGYLETSIPRCLLGWHAALVENLHLDHLNKPTAEADRGYLRLERWWSYTQGRDQL